MSDEEYAEFRERSEVSYAAAIAASRAVSLPEARRQAAEDHEQPAAGGCAYSGPLPVDGLRATSPSVTSGCIWREGRTVFTPSVMGSRCARNFAGAAMVGR